MGNVLIKTAAELQAEAAQKRQEDALLDVLSVDKWTLDADNIGEIAVTYTSREPVHFVVDGDLHTVEPVDRVATLTISADAPGPIQVQVKAHQLVITAVEVPT